MVKGLKGFGNVATGANIAGITVDGSDISAQVAGKGFDGTIVGRLLGDQVENGGVNPIDLAAKAGAEVTRVQESPFFQDGEGPKEGEVAYGRDSVQPLWG